jgi:hypothetical protein
VSDDGIKTDPDMVSVVKNWPAIKNVKDLRKLLGFTSYYRRFIQDNAKIVKPHNKPKIFDFRLEKLAFLTF